MNQTTESDEDEAETEETAQGEESMSFTTSSQAAILSKQIEEERNEYMSRNTGLKHQLTTLKDECVAARCSATRPHGRSGPVTRAHAAQSVGLLEGRPHAAGCHPRFEPQGGPHEVPDAAPHPQGYHQGSRGLFRGTLSWRRARYWLLRSAAVERRSAFPVAATARWSRAPIRPASAAGLSAWGDRGAGDKGGDAAASRAWRRGVVYRRRPCRAARWRSGAAQPRLPRWPCWQLQPLLLLSPPLLLLWLLLWLWWWLQWLDALRATGTAPISARFGDGAAAAACRTAARLPPSLSLPIDRSGHRALHRHRGRRAQQPAGSTTRRRPAAHRLLRVQEDIVAAVAKALRHAAAAAAATATAAERSGAGAGAGAAQRAACLRAELGLVARLAVHLAAGLAHVRAVQATPALLAPKAAFVPRLARRNGLGAVTLPPPAAGGSAGSAGGPPALRRLRGPSRRDRRSCRSAGTGSGPPIAIPLSARPRQRPELQQRSSPRRLLLLLLLPVLWWSVSTVLAAPRRRSTQRPRAAPRSWSGRRRRGRSPRPAWPESGPQSVSGDSWRGRAGSGHARISAARGPSVRTACRSRPCRRCALRARPLSWSRAACCRCCT